MFNIIAKGFDSIGKSCQLGSVNFDLSQFVGKKNEECWMELSNAKDKINMGFKITILLPDQIENKEEFKQNIEEEEFKEVIVPEVVSEQEPDEETLKKISEMQQLKVQHYIQEIWKKFDTDGNGTLDKAEFKNFVSETMSELIGEDKTDLIEQDFEKVFNGFDADSGGSINQEEMYNFLETLFGENYSKDIDVSAIEQKRKQIEQEQLNEIAKIKAKIEEKDTLLAAIDGK